jgi:amidase
MDELLTLPATEAARLVRAREVSARELTRLLLDRIDKAGPVVNAVAEVDAEAGLRAAADADEATASGDDLGPLHGVPMTIKEAFDVEGLHTTWGDPAFAEHVATADSTVAARLRAAGAIIVGKSNVHLMLADFGQTANPLHGVTRNPWDPDRSPGGSSGGAAAALAAGMTFLEYGSDLVGSIRIPAAYCGVYGLRPSAGTVPLTGFQPPGPPAPPSELPSMSSAGPMARSAGDLRTALAVTGGPEGAAAHAYHWALAPPRRTRLAGLRVGVVLDHPGVPVTSETGAVLSDAVDALARAGVTIVEGWPDGVDPDRSAESFGFQVRLFFALQGMGGDPPLAEVAEQEAERLRVRAAWSRHFEDVDVFLSPVSFTTAPAHDDRPFEARTIATPEGDRPYGDQTWWVAHAALAGLPALSAPAGRTPGGLPAGLQIAGPLHEDDTAITAAELLADVIGGYEPPPL